MKLCPHLFQYVEISRKMERLQAELQGKPQVMPKGKRQDKAADDSESNEEADLGLGSLAVPSRGRGATREPQSRMRSSGTSSMDDVSRRTLLRSQSKSNSMNGADEDSSGTPKFQPGSDRGTDGRTESKEVVALQEEGVKKGFLNGMKARRRTKGSIFK